MSRFLGGAVLTARRPTPAIRPGGGSTRGSDCPNGRRRLPSVCGRCRSIWSAQTRNRWQQAARSAALVNAMSTRFRPATADERIRAPTSPRATSHLRRTDAALRARGHTLTVPLITRRSQVQILPPPPSNTSSEALFAQRGGPLRLPVSTRCQRPGFVRAGVQAVVLVGVRGRLAVVVARGSWH